jgi:hypothetical protein
MFNAVATQLFMKDVLACELPSEYNNTVYKVTEKLMDSQWSSGSTKPENALFHHKSDPINGLYDDIDYQWPLLKKITTNKELAKQ